MPGDRSLTVDETFIMQALLRSDLDLEDLIKEFSWDQELADTISEGGDYPSDYITEIDPKDIRKAIKSLRKDKLIRGTSTRGYSITVRGARILVQ